MTEVNLKNVQSQRSDQENEEDGSDVSKKEQRVIQKSLVQKGANLTRNERQQNDLALLLNLVFHLYEEKREVRSEAKRGEGEDTLGRLCLHRLLIP